MSAPDADAVELHRQITERHALLTEDSAKLLDLLSKAAEALATERERRIALELRIVELEHTVASAGGREATRTGERDALADNVDEARARIEKDVEALKAFRARSGLMGRVEHGLVMLFNGVVERLTQTANLYLQTPPRHGSVQVTAEEIDQLPGRVMRGPFHLVKGGRP